MIDERENICTSCQRGEISDYIDGELTPARVMELEFHFTDCKPCAAELTEQKQFLCGLNSSLMQELEIELPADFARKVAANAESSVSGVRRPRELYNAVFICAGLGLFVLFASGTESTKAFGGVYGFAEQAAVAAALLLRIIYAVFYGAVIVLRSFVNAVEGDLAIGFGVAAMVMAMIVISLRVGRMRGV